jgi:CheY-like chemotaxis protein
MPDGNGIDILRQIRQAHPNTHVLVVSGLSEKQYAINVLRAGASGDLAKDQAPEDSRGPCTPSWRAGGSSARRRVRRSWRRSTSLPINPCTMPFRNASSRFCSNSPPEYGMRISCRIRPPGNRLALAYSLVKQFSDTQ